MLLSKLHQIVHLARHSFLRFANVSTLDFKLSSESLNFRLIVNKLLRCDISDGLLFEVTMDFLQLSVQLLLHVTVMNLVDVELLNIEFDILRNIQVIKWSIRLNRPDINIFQDFLRIKK